MQNITNRSSVESVKYTPHLVQAAQYTGAALCIAFTTHQVLVESNTIAVLKDAYKRDSLSCPPTPEHFLNRLQMEAVKVSVIAVVGLFGAGLGRLAGWAGYHTARAVDCGIHSLSKHFQRKPKGEPVPPPVVIPGAR